MEKTLKELAKEIHQNSVDHGFYENEGIALTACSNDNSVKHAFFAQKIALIHSELSEALEADRENKFADISNLKMDDEFEGCFQSQFERLIKNTVGDELADAIIHILGLSDQIGIDIQKHVEWKMKYNSLREYKHGKEY